MFYPGGYHTVQRRVTNVENGRNRSTLVSKVEFFDTIVSDIEPYIKEKGDREGVAGGVTIVVMEKDGRRQRITARFIVTNKGRSLDRSRADKLLELKPGTMVTFYGNFLRNAGNNGGADGFEIDEDPVVIEEPSEDTIALSHAEPLGQTRRVYDNGSVPENVQRADQQDDVHMVGDAVAQDEGNTPS